MQGSGFWESAETVQDYCTLSITWVVERLASLGGGVLDTATVAFPLTWCYSLLRRCAVAQGE